MQKRILTPGRCRPRYQYAMHSLTEHGGRGGATVLLLHGLGSRGADLAGVAKTLAEAWRCLTPDLFGHGGRPGDEVETLADYASDLSGLPISDGPLAVAGFSLGAWIALELWHSAPRAVTCVVLVDPPATTKPLLRWARAGGADEATVRQRLIGLYREQDPQRVMEQMRDHPATCDLDQEGLRRNAEALLMADRATLSSSLVALQRWRMPGRPRGSRAPVIVLRGTRSVLCPRTSAGMLALRLGGAVARFDGGHSAHLSAPHEVGDALLRQLGTRWRGGRLRPLVGRAVSQALAPRGA
jgi:pimeloyl-ACP methyl ester carboxylesterase